MTDEYREAVRNHYFRLTESGFLSSNLLYITPAKVRNECARQYEEIASDWDWLTIKNFMGRAFRDDLSLSEIKEMDPSRLKPFIQFLKEGRKSSELAVEMAAWLLDFRPRPYSHYAYTKLTESGRTANPYLVASFQKNGVSESHVEIQENQNGATYLSDEVSVQENSSLAIVRDRLLSLPDNDGEGQTGTPVMIEYPSGVRVIVRTSDLSFISGLVKL